MERMTERGEDGYYVPAARAGATIIYAPQAEVKQRFEGKIVDRLGEYEECGMEPHEVKSMNQMWSSDAKALQQMRKNYEEIIKKYQELLYGLCFDDDGSQVLTLDEVIALAKAKKEGRCIVLGSPVSGTAQVLVDGKLEERKVKEVVISRHGESKSVTVLVDEGKPKKEYPEYILRYLRQRRGMKPDDTSRDDMFQSMKPRAVFGEALIWNGLLRGWDSQIIGWIKDIYGIDLEG